MFNTSLLQHRVFLPIQIGFFPGNFVALDDSPIYKLQ